MRTDIQYTKDRYGYSRKVETMAFFLLCGSQRNEGVILRLKSLNVWSRSISGVSVLNFRHSPGQTRAEITVEIPAIIITENLGFVDVSATELRLNYLLNKNNIQVHAESVKELNNHVNCIRNKMKNPQVDGQKIYQEYLEGGHPNPSSLEDLR